MRIYLPRFYVRDLPANLDALRRDVADAAAQDADLIVFPEVFLTGYRGEADPQLMHDEFATLSAAHGEMLCVFGSLSEQGRNRTSVYLGGRVVAHYDKVHLFEPNGEREMWTPGDCYCALQHGDWRIGLGLCNDVRFPELSRELKLRGDINLLLYPALWPWQRDHIWSALLRARAIENGCFAVGCCVAGVDNGLELFDGAGNHVFDPLGDAVHPQGRMYELDPVALDRVIVDPRSQHRGVERVELRTTATQPLLMAE